MAKPSLQDVHSAMTAPAAPAFHRRESRVVWASTEGQIVNGAAYAWALLLCWLVVPVLYASYRYLKTANHRYELTDQRLLERSGIVVKTVETLELYRVKDIQVSGTVLQSLFGRGRVRLLTTDASTPEVVINAVANPEHVAQLIREIVEFCRGAKGVRTFDY